MYFILDENGYVLGSSNYPFITNGVGSTQLPAPNDFNMDYCYCYKWTGEEWIFDSSKIQVENVTLPTLEQRLEATEAAILVIMEMGLMPNV